MSSYNDIVKWWSNLEKNTIEDYQVLLNNFQILFASHTNNIEGISVNYHTTRDVFEGKNVNNYSGPVENLFVVRNQKFASEYLTKSVIAKKPITIDFIKKVHKILMYGSYDQTRWGKGERPGKFKIGDYCIGLMDIGSLPDEVNQDMQELVDELNTATITDVLTASAYFHCKFESIHPFADGNGRVGRTLLNYFLMLHNYPPLIIFDEDKNVYYMALEVFDRTGEISGMEKFLQEQTIKTWSKHLPFNKMEYLEKFLPLLPEASVAACKTKEDCDALLERLGVKCL